MAESLACWLVEEGIGEERALLVEHGTVKAARLHWPGGLTAGQIADALLVSREARAARGLVRFECGEEALIDGLPREASEGARIRVRVTRAALAEIGRLKLAQVRPTGQPSRAAPSLSQSLIEQGQTVRTVRRFPDSHWPELIAEALEGLVDFAGGTLTLTPAPAMTLIDVDGRAAPVSLAVAACPAVAGAIRRLDLSGSIGIDFPSVESRRDRATLDNSLAAALANWPHQRTAMNGFGFVQIVARLERPSILHLVQLNRAGAAARALLRHAESVTEPGALLLTAHPAVRGAVLPEWEVELRRRTGREVRWCEKASLALLGGFAQAVPI